MPKRDFTARWAARLFRSAVSEMLSISPVPNTGVGMRNTTLFRASWPAQSSCWMLQVDTLVRLGFAGKIFLLDVASGRVAGRVDASADGEERMHSAIRRAVRLPLEACFTNRDLLRDERWQRVWRA